MDSRAMEGNGSSETATSRGPIRNWDQIKVPGLHPSMSMSDLMNHIESRLSEQITSSNPSSSAGQQPEVQDMLDEIAQYLLNDNQLSTSSDEKSLMTRVNSLCCLLQKEPTALQQQHSPVESVSFVDGSSSGEKSVAHEESGTENPNGKMPPSMNRIDSFGDLLLHLPRIASLPKFLFNISEEDGDSQSS